MPLVYYPAAPVDGGTLSTSADSFSVCQLTSSKFLAVYTQKIPDYIIGRVIDVDTVNNTVSAGDQWIINISPNVRTVMARRVDNNKAIVVFSDNGTKSKAFVVNVSGKDLIFLSSYPTTNINDFLISGLPVQVVETGTSSLIYVSKHHSLVNIHYYTKIIVSSYEVSSFSVVRSIGTPFSTDFGDVISWIPRYIPASSSVLPMATGITGSFTTTNNSAFPMRIGSVQLNNFYAGMVSGAVSAESSSLPIIIVSGENYGNNYQNISAKDVAFDYIGNDKIVVNYSSKIFVQKYDAPPYTNNQIIHPYILSNDTNIRFVRYEPTTGEFITFDEKRVHVFKFITGDPLTSSVIKSSAFATPISAAGYRRMFIKYSDKISSCPYDHVFRISKEYFAYFFRDNTANGPVRIMLVYPG